MKTVGAVIVLAAALITAPAPAYADCGDPGQDPCTGPVPTVDQVLAIMAELTDPNIPAANKGDIVTPAFTDEQAGKFDTMLNEMNGGGMKQRDAANLVDRLGTAWKQAVKRQICHVGSSDRNVDGALLKSHEALLGVTDVDQLH